MEQLRQQHSQENNLGVDSVRGAEHLFKFRKEKREYNIIKDVRSIFRLKKKTDENTIKSIRNIFRLEIKQLRMK